MTRTTRIVGAALITFVAAACADWPTSVIPSATMQSGRFAMVAAGECTTLSALNGLARALFTNGQPNVNSVLGKLKNLDQQVKKGKLAQAQAQAHEIVAFTLKKNAQRALGGTDEQLDEFIENVYCYAGIDVDVEEPDNTFLIMPSDLPQVITDLTGTGGISFPANPVFEPTLIEFMLIDDTFDDGAGPLDTKLDQYPGFLQITMTNETQTGLAQPAVVGVCANGAIPQAVRDRLRLGHGKATGFEIAAPGNADFLTCENATEIAAAEPLWRKLASLVAPRALQASTVRLSGGGVGGTVTEFSPFAPVDPVLSFSGGVGGTVTEFIREISPVANLTTAATEAMLVDCTVGIGGTAVAPECRPAITITTNLGTVLTGVPVTWNVTAGGGTVAPRTGFCGTYGSTANTTTNALGMSAVCWNLGSLGTNSVKATPSAGGDAPAGVTFVPAEFDFSVTAVAGAPVLISPISVQNQVGEAGAAVPTAPRVRVTDAHGNGVSGVVVNWGIWGGGGSVSSPTTLTDANGEATVSWILGATPGYNNMYAYIFHEAGGLTYFEATGSPPP